MKPSIFDFQKYSSLTLFAAVMFLLSLPVNIAAKTVAEYRQNVQTAKNSVDDLIEYYDEPEDGEPDPKYVKEAVAKIKKNLPAEKIEWQGASVETDYGWLNRKLEIFAAEKDDDKRIEILTAVSERLEALETKLAELDNPAASGGKDEAKRKLAEILKREEYQKPEPKGENIFQRWYREFMEWLEKLFPTPNITPGNSTDFSGFSYVLQILLYAAVAGIAGFLIYKFAPFLLNKYSRREKREKKERVILGERIGKDETAENLFGEAEALARAGNLRAAIRKGYVALLCELSDRKIIGLAQHKTNRDYLRDVRSNRELYENMSGLTDSFENHWYGSQIVGEEDWNEFRNEYKKITNFKLRITN